MSNVTQLACCRGGTQPQVSGTLVFWVWEGTSNIGFRTLCCGLFLTPRDWFQRGSGKYMKYHSVRCLVAVSPTRSCNRAVQAIWTPLFLMRFYLDLLSKSKSISNLHPPFIALLLTVSTWVLCSYCPYKGPDWICLPCSAWLRWLCNNNSQHHMFVRHFTKDSTPILSFNPLNNLLRYILFFYLHMA